MSARQVRRFELERDIDVSGVSGTGTVAFGAQAPDGTCVLWWDSMHESIGIYPTMETLLAIHGHGGMTRVVYIDGLDQPGMGVPPLPAVPGTSVGSPSPASGVPAATAAAAVGVPSGSALPSRPGASRRIGTTAHSAASGHGPRSSSAHPASGAGDGR